MCNTPRHSINLGDELEKLGFNPVLEYLKALIDNDYKRASAIGRALPYVGIKLPPGTWVKRLDIPELLAKTCPYLNECSNCQEIEKKRLEKEI